MFSPTPTPGRQPTSRVLTHTPPRVDSPRVMFSLIYTPPRVDSPRVMFSLTYTSPRVDSDALSPLPLWNLSVVLSSTRGCWWCSMLLSGTPLRQRAVLPYHGSRYSLHTARGTPFTQHAVFLMCNTRYSSHTLLCNPLITFGTPPL